MRRNIRITKGETKTHHQIAPFKLYNIANINWSNHLEEEDIKCVSRAIWAIFSIWSKCNCIIIYRTFLIEFRWFFFFEFVVIEGKNRYFGMRPISSSQKSFLKELRMEYKLFSKNSKRIATTIYIYILNNKFFIKENLTNMPEQFKWFYFRIIAWWS